GFRAVGVVVLQIVRLVYEVTFAPVAVDDARQERLRSVRSRRVSADRGGVPLEGDLLGARRPLIEDGGQVLLQLGQCPVPLAREDVVRRPRGAGQLCPAGEGVQRGA